MAHRALAGQRIAGEWFAVKPSVAIAAVVPVRVFERFIYVAVQLLQEIESADDLAGTVEILQPFLQLWSVVRIAGKAVLNQHHLLFRAVLEREEARGRLDQTLDELILVQVDVHLESDLIVARTRN